MSYAAFASTTRGWNDEAIDLVSQAWAFFWPKKSKGLLFHTNKQAAKHTLGFVAGVAATVGAIALYPYVRKAVKIAIKKAEEANLISSQTANSVKAAVEPEDAEEEDTKTADPSADTAGATDDKPKKKKRKPIISVFRRIVGALTNSE